MSHATRQRARSYAMDAAFRYYTGELVHDESDTLELWLSAAPSRVLQELEAIHPGVVIHNDAARTRSEVVDLMWTPLREDLLKRWSAEGITVVGLDVIHDGHLEVRVMGDVPTVQARFDAMFGSGVARVEYGEPARAGQVIASFPDRWFRPWEYRISHSMLLVRSPMVNRAPTNTDLIFTMVGFMSLPSSMAGVTIEEGGREDLDRLYASAHANHMFPVLTGYMNVFVLISENRRYLVVASACDVQEHEGDIFDSPFDVD